MSVTMQDIAKKVGVSRTTVGYILNNKPISSQITDETRERVLEMAKRLNYRTNQIAISLTRNKTKTIGVVFTNARGTFMNEILEGIDHVVHQHGYNISLCIPDDDWRREARHIQMLREKRVDGMIVFFVSCRRGEKINHDHLLEVKKDGIPLVFIDRYLPDTDIDYVVTDDFGGSYEAVTHLLKLGHKKIAHITIPLDCTSVRNRLEGYKKALIDAGIEINEEYIKTADFSKNDGSKYGGYEITKDFLKMEKERPTAIFTVIDGIAIDAFRAVKETGLSIPEDIALVGFGNDERLSHLEVPLTVVEQPKSEIGEKGAEILINKIENPGTKEVKKIAIKPELIVRQSCGAKNGMVTAGTIS